MIIYRLKEEFSLIKAVTGDQVKMPAGSAFSVVTKASEFSMLRHRGDGKKGGLFAVSNDCLRDTFYWDITDENTEN